MLPQSQAGRAILIMTLAMEALESGRFVSNSRAYRIMSWVRQRYQVELELVFEVLNGIVRLRHG